MEILYCDKCGFRVPSTDLDAGRAFRIDDKIFCARCAPAQQVESASKKKNDSKLVPALEIPKRKSSERMTSMAGKDSPRPSGLHVATTHDKRPSGIHITPSSASTPAADHRRAAAPAAKQNKPAGLPVVPIAAGAAVCALLLGAIMFSGGDSDKQKKTASADSTPDTTSKKIEPQTRLAQTPDTTSAHRSGPSFLDNPPASPAPVEHLPVTQMPLPPKDDAEAQASDAFDKVRRFEGLDAGNTAERIKRLEDYVAKYGDTIASARARALIDTLKNGGDKPAAPTPAPVPQPAIPDSLPPAALAVSKSSDSREVAPAAPLPPQIMPEEFANLKNHALAANGATAAGHTLPDQMIDGNFTTYTEFSGYAQSPVNEPLSVTLAESTDINCIRFLLWDKDDRFYRYKLDVCDDDLKWTTVADKADEKSQCKSWQVIRFPARKVKSIRCIGTYNSHDTLFHIIELQAFGTQHADAAPVTATAPDTVLFAENFDGPACDGLHFGDIAEGPPDSHGKVMQLKGGDGKNSRGLIATWAMKPGQTRKVAIPVGENTRIRFRYFDTNAREISLAVVTEGDEVAYHMKTNLDVRGKWTDVDVSMRDFMLNEKALKPGSIINSIVFASWGNTASQTFIDDIWFGDPGAKLPAGPANVAQTKTGNEGSNPPAAPPAPPPAKLTPAEISHLEIPASIEWSNIVGLVNSGRWDRARSAIDEFKVKFGATAFAGRKTEDAKTLLVRCAEGPLNKGLVGYWKLDEGKGNLTADTSGNNNTGKVTGAEWIAGKSGSALSFNGSEDFVDVPDKPALRITGSLTLSLWFKNGGKVRNWSRLASKGWGKAEAPWMSYAIHLDAGEDGNQHAVFKTCLNTDSITEVISNTPMENGKWHNLTGVFDPQKSRIAIYVDGVKETEAPLKNPTIASTTSDFRIGDDWATKEKVKGVIDEVRLYDRVLTDAEITALFNLYK